MSDPADPVGGALRRALQRLPTAQRPAALLQDLLGRAARFLALPVADGVPASSSWQELGFDSLRALDFRTELEAELAFPLRSTLLFDHPTPAALVDHLLERLALPAASPGEAPPALPVAGTGPLAGPQVVLCVGDSSTFGVGCSNPAEHSYPAALQVLLRQRVQRDVVVVNCGLPGSNSRDVLLRLPAQLAEFRPRVVCVTVGAIDFWECPELLPEGAAADTVDQGEQQRRRQVPLAALQRVRPQEPGHEGAAAPCARGPEWAPRQPQFRSAYDDLPVKWQATPESLAHQAEGWRRDAANEVREALVEFERAFAACPDDAQTRHMLVKLYHASGRSDAAAPHLQWLIDSWERDQDLATGRSLVVAFEQCGRLQDVVRVAAAVLARFPADGLTWRYRATSELHLGRPEEASRSIAESIRLFPDRWSYFWRQLIQRALGDVEGAVRTVYEAYVVFNDAKVAANDLRAVLAAGNHASPRSVLASFACEPDVKARLEQIVDEVHASANGAAATAVLSAHLRRIATLVRDAGAVPVFVPYHFAQISDGVVRTVASELEVRFVELSDHFEQRLAPRRREDLQAPDGHCNDEGYRLVAAIVADAMHGLLAAAASAPRPR